MCTHVEYTCLAYIYIRVMCTLDVCPRRVYHVGIPWPLVITWPLGISELSRCISVDTHEPRLAHTRSDEYLAGITWPRIMYVTCVTVLCMSRVSKCLCMSRVSQYYVCHVCHSVIYVTCVTALYMSRVSQCCVRHVCHSIIHVKCVTGLCMSRVSRLCMSRVSQWCRFRVLTCLHQGDGARQYWRGSLWLWCPIKAHICIYLYVYHMCTTYRCEFVCWCIYTRETGL